MHNSGGPTWPIGRRRRLRPTHVGVIFHGKHRPRSEPLTREAAQSSVAARAPDLYMDRTGNAKDGRLLRVLLVGDSEADARDRAARLEAGGYRVVSRRVETARQMAMALVGSAWDVIVSDWRLARFSGPAALALVRGMNADTPFIIVSGVADEETAVTAVRAGAQDFVERGNLVRLLPAVERAVGEARIRRDHGRVEAALADVRERLQFTLEQVPAICWTTDRAFRITSSLGSGLRAIGVEEHAVDGRHVEEAVGSPDPVLRGAHEAALDGRSSTFEREWFGRHYRCLVSPYREPGQGTVGVIGVALDVTEEKRIEVEARSRERRFQSLIEKSSDVLSILDAEGRIIYESPAIAALTGHDPDQLVGHDAFELIHEDDRPRIRDVWAATLGAGAHTAGARFRIRHRDGGWREVEATATNLLDDPAVAGVIVNTRDITERVEAERQVRFQAQLLDAVHQAIIATDLDGRILYWNRFAEELYGWAREEVLGRDINEVTVPDGSRRHAGEIWERLRAGRSWSGEFVLRRRDGSEFHGAVADAPIFDEGGAVVGVVGSSSDLTERRRLEAQLRHAQKMEAVGRLAGGVAHDFNNLLTAIRGYAGFLLEDLPDGPSRSDVEEIQRVTERAVALTRQLLVFGKRQMAQPRVLDVNAVVTELREMLERILGEDIEFVCDLAAPLPPVLIDRAQLEQVLMNLLLNGRDAMPDGGRLSITTRRAPAGGGGGADGAGSGDGVVELTVADTGHGIPDDALSRIFEPFFSTKGSGGTGLGLATVYAIVEQAGGDVRVDTEVGRGSAFVVRFPAVAGDAEADAGGPLADRGAGGTGTILLVEDEPQVRAVVRRTLEQGGYDVLEAEDGVEALKVATVHDGDLAALLTDVVLPGMSGPDLAERLRPVHPGLPVLFMSGYTEDVAALQRLTGRDDPLLNKPFTPDALLAAVGRVVRNGAGR